VRHKEAIMRWSDQERRAFFELWGEEAPPQGWNLWVERASHLLGEDRALARIGTIHVGGDPVCAALALRAHARHTPTAHALWVPPSFWGACAYPWLADREDAERLSVALGQPVTSDLSLVLRRVRDEAFALLETFGGSWVRTRGPVRWSPVDNGWVWVAAREDRKRPDHPPVGDVERRLVSLHHQSVSATPCWPKREAAMMGGCAERVCVLGPDRWRKDFKKADFFVELDLPYPGVGSISSARSLWWARIEALVSSPCPV
jgi:hypothetical protein